MKRLRQTEKALEEYEEFYAGFDARMDAVRTDADLYGLELELLQAAKKVGEAYGRDTADFNDMDTCRGCVRPGKWLDRMVALGAADEG